MPRGHGWSEEKIFSHFPYMRAIVGPERLPEGRGWDALFDANPDMVQAIFADIIKQTYATPGKVGQRPMPAEEDIIEDLDWIFESEPNREPMSACLPKLMKTSERNFCTKINMSRRTFQRLLLNDYTPDINEIRQIAQAVDKPPAFFVEYRRRMLFSALGHMIMTQPQFVDWLYSAFIYAAGEAKRKGNASLSSAGVKSMRKGIETIYSIADELDIEVRIRPRIESNTRSSRKQS